MWKFDPPQTLWGSRTKGRFLAQKQTNKKNMEFNAYFIWFLEAFKYV